MSNQVTVESVTILENGVYTAPAGKAYSPVTVNVPTYDVDSLSVTENGTYTPETGNAYNSVTVNVPQAQLSSLSVTENGTYTPETGNAYNSVVVNVPAAGITASVTFVAAEGITLFGVMTGVYLVDGTQTYTADNQSQFPAGVATTVPILDSIVLYDFVCYQDQSTPLANVTFDLEGAAEFNLNDEIVITGDCVITVKNAQ